MTIWNPFVWYSQYQLDKLKLKLDAQNKPFETLASAIGNQAEFIKAYFEGFKVTEIPTSTIIRDEDAYIAEQQRVEPHAELKQSIRNALSAGAMPDLKDILNN